MDGWMDGWVDRKLGRKRHKKGTLFIKLPFSVVLSCLRSQTVSTITVYINGLLHVCNTVLYATV